MKHLSTKAIHGAEDPMDNQYGDIVTPIHMSVTFAKERITETEHGYIYSRTANPTRDKLESKLAMLEDAECGLAFSSGMAAETTLLMATLSSGSTIVALDDLYGGTKRLFRIFSEKFKMKIVYVDATNASNLKKAVKNVNPELVWIETPSNPLLKIVDIRESVEIAHEENALVVVDNTFASPVFQKPLLLGADIVVHSATKYISGHSDVLAGSIMLNNRELCGKMKFLQNALGAVLSAHDSWLLLRSIKTLPLRMKKHEENAMKIAEYLSSHDLVKRVLYPGLTEHPGHEIAKRQMTGFSGMLSFELRGRLKDAVTFVEALKIFKLAESLGGVESLVEIPSLMTHASVPREEREKLGISDTLIRMSVGIEDLEDLLDDINNAFSKLDT
ncbi:MAG: PLP-dependent aspartate aminotransferase family protein [Desulfurococcales archaeon]|nr:PLP-dependent aspartate aminotransferase family protein [Desulfurococcales archaeon]